MGKKLLEVKDLSVSFNTYAGEVQALRGISFSVDRGETLALLESLVRGNQLPYRQL